MNLVFPGIVPMVALFLQSICPPFIEPTPDSNPPQNAVCTLHAIYQLTIYAKRIQIIGLIQTLHLVLPFLDDSYISWVSARHVGKTLQEKHSNC